MSPSLSFQDVTRLIQKGRQRLKVFGLLENGSVLLALGIVLWLSAPLAEAAAPFFPYAVPVYALLFFLIVVFLGCRLAFGILRPIPQEKVARYLEHEHPLLRNQILNAWQLQKEVIEGKNQGRASVDLAAAAIDQASQVIRKAPDLRLQYPTAVRSRLLTLIPLGVAFVGSWMFFPSGVQRTAALLLNPFAAIPPRHVSIALSPGQVKIPRGDSLEIVATTTGPLPKQVMLTVYNGDGRELPIAMAAAGPARFRTLLPQVNSSFRYEARVGSDRSPLYQVEVIDLPAAGNFQIQYIYPEYTGLAPEAREGSGHVEALKGTEVILKVKANKKISRAVMVFDDGTRRAMQISPENALGARIVALASTGYHLELEDTEGFKNRHPVHYDFRTIADQLPVVEIVNPPPEMSVDEYQIIDLGFTAGDDFGLSSVTLVYRLKEGPEQRIRIGKAGVRERKISGHYLWDLGLLSLEPGTVVRYHLEAQDNDVFSGPKTGFSAEHVLIVHSAQERHRGVQDLQRDLAEKLLDLLGNQLQYGEKLEQFQEGRLPPADAERVEKELREEHGKLKDRLNEVVDRLNEGLQRMEKDPLSDVSTLMDLDTLKRNLQFLQDEFKARPRVGSQPFTDRQEKVTSELEKAALLAEETLQRQKMRDLMQSTQNITNMQRGLLDALDQLAQKFDPNLMRSLMDTLGKLQNLMQQMMESLSQLARQMPDEFINQMSGETLNFGDLFRDLQELQRLLQAGDLEAARQLAQNFMRALSQMMASLQGMFNMAQNFPFNMSQRESEKASNILQELIETQKQLLKDTGNLDSKLSDLLNKRQQELFPDLQKRLRDTLGQVREKLKGVGEQTGGDLNRGGWDLRWSLDRLRDTLRQMEREIAERHLEEGKLRLKEALAQEENLARRLRSQMSAGELSPELRNRVEKSFEAMREALRSLEKDLQRLPGRNRDVVGEQEAGEFGELQNRQRALQDKTEALLNKLRELSFLTPFLGPELLEGLEGAAGSMGEAKTQLGERASREAIPPEQEAINRLSQTQSNLQNAMQQMAQRGRLMGTPAPMLSQAGISPYYFRGMREPPMRQPDRSFQERGRQGVSERDFQLPGREDYRAPEVFRQGVIRSLQDKIPSQYKGKVEKYFENLTE
ncbi:MAG: DUF4175 family protein [Candidatus Tectomicrobia bacterium]|uniref:DUF4175 family protein n=1 Tax=Tectimicrobiota bacterium TaxID=2528274 RepID=A0A932GPL2_UNCTE|nr:DUF4175 family protein [Candidatus Tectomicrobia bacterium]